MGGDAQDKLLSLVFLQRQALQAKNLEQLIHIIVNGTHKLFPYNQAVFFQVHGNQILLEAVSGNAKLDPLSPHALEIKEKISRHLHHADGDVFMMETEEETCNALMLLRTPETGVIGGLYFDLDVAFHDAEMQILSELSVSYTHALSHQKIQGLGLIPYIKRKFGQVRLFVLLSLILVMFFPVREHITAPAEVIAQDPFVISAPYDGVIESVSVDPGEHVIAGTPLIRMDKMTLQAKVDSTTKEVNAAQDQRARLRREILSNPKKSPDLQNIENELALKQIDLSFAEELLTRSAITSPIEGVAIFSDKNTLLGQPVHKGQALMTVADSTKQELLIRIPAGSMIDFDRQAPIKFYANVRPFQSIKAQIKTIGYQASPDPDRLLSYKVRAVLDEEAKNLRIGWKGSAKIYGGYTVYGYVLLRKPLMFIREITGL